MKLVNAHSQVKAMGEHLAKIERGVDKLLERTLDASVPSVIAAYEERVRRLESEKMVLKERMTKKRVPPAADLPLSFSSTWS